MHRATCRTGPRRGCRSPCRSALAIGAILECHRRGWAVPGRVAIANFDDQEMAVQVTPSLTSIRIPRAEIGRRAAEIIFEHPRRTAPACIDVGFEIIRRDST